MEQRFRTITRVGALGVAAALALSGCSATSAGDPNVVEIVTTTTQVTDFVRQITAGTNAQITPLLSPGESAHSYEATPAELAAITKADLVIASGYGLEPWLDPALSSAGFAGTRVDAADAFDPAKLHEGHDHAGATTPPAEATTAPADDGHGPDDHAGHDHGGHDHGGHAGATTPPADAGHDHGDHGGHDHGDRDPHVWSAPGGAEVMVRAITEALATADPAHAEQLRANGAAYVAKLNALDGWIRQNIDTIPEAQRLVVMNHNALGYFNEAYHVTFVGSIMPSWDDNAEPSAAELDKLIADIRATGVKAIFTETQLAPTAAERLATETGVQVFSGDRALYTDALGTEGSPEGSYLGATIHNTRMLMESWGGQAGPLPAELAQS